jgi:hypothetical protein
VGTECFSIGSTEHGAKFCTIRCANDCTDDLSQYDVSKPIAEFGANVDGTHDSQHNARFNLSTKHIAVNVTDIGANGGTKRCANAIRAAAGRSTRDRALFRCTTPAVWEWSALLRRIRICCRCAWVRLENARACASPIAAG